MRRRPRFDELVRRQLDLFEVDQAPLLEEANAAEEAWVQAGREEAEERYGDYQLLAAAVAELLYEVRETYASSLDEATGEEYRAAFNRAALKRFRRYSGLLGLE
jgi:hypothetical protein